MPITHETWQIDGANSNPILGDAHIPEAPPKGVVLVVHGFLGFKDYGMFPHIAEAFARAGFLAHRFNLSTSGMDNRADSYDPATFQRPDLFEQDTWLTQVADIEAVSAAAFVGDIPGRTLPQVFFGHSRGGVSVLLACGHRALNGIDPPRAVISASAPAGCNFLTEAESEAMLRDGRREFISNRTKQTLRLDANWLREQQNDPDRHDLLALASAIACPMLLIHGETDPSVDVSSVHALGNATADQARTDVIAGADHVFNTPNPFDMNARPSPQLARLEAAAIGFAEDAIR